MSVRIRAGLTSAAVTSVGLLAPATAAPKLPEGCTFDGATGTSTCRTTSVVTTRTETSSNPVGDFFNDDSSLFFTLCKAAVPDSFVAATPGSEFVTIAVAQTTTVTTTSYKGVATGKGNKPTTTATQTTKTIGISQDGTGGVACLVPAPGGGALLGGGVIPGDSFIVG